MFFRSLGSAEYAALGYYLFDYFSYQMGVDFGYPGIAKGAASGLEEGNTSVSLDNVWATDGSKNGFKNSNGFKNKYPQFFLRLSIQSRKEWLK